MEKMNSAVQTYITFHFSALNFISRYRSFLCDIFHKYEKVPKVMAINFFIDYCTFIFVPYDFLHFFRCEIVGLGLTGDWS